MLVNDQLGLFEWCVEAGFLQDRRLEACPKCHQEKTLKVEVVRGGVGIHYICPKPCRHCESVTEREPGFFLKRVPLTKQMLIVWTFINFNQPGADKLAEAAEVNEHIALEVISNIRRLTTYWMIRANLVLQVGAYGQDVEADEVSFRSKAVAKDGKPMMMWARFIGVVRRGSSLCYWGRLETRFTESKKGGGGKLGIEELKYHMLRRGEELGYCPRPLLAPGSILHADTASSYMRLHRLEQDPRHAFYKYWVTQVRHSRKQDERGNWLPVQYVIWKKVQLPDGTWVWRKGGTQKKDGFWASVRRHVSRRAVSSDKQPVLQQMAYFFQ